MVHTHEAARGGEDPEDDDEEPGPAPKALALLEGVLALGPVVRWEADADAVLEALAGVRAAGVGALGGIAGPVLDSRVRERAFRRGQGHGDAQQQC